MLKELVCRIFGHARASQHDLGLRVMSMAEGYQCPRCSALVNSHGANSRTDRLVNAPDSASVACPHKNMSMPDSKNGAGGMQKPRFNTV
jgi:hypothetical protein